MFDIKSSFGKVDREPTLFKEITGSIPPVQVFKIYLKLID